MKNDLSVESVLSELKKNLSKYESIIKDCESNPSKKKISEVESSKKKIEQKIKMVKTIISTEDDNFMLESYEDLKNELNKKLKLIIKKYEDRKDKNNDNDNDLFTYHKKKENKNNYYDNDDLNLNNNVRISTDYHHNSNIDDEFAQSEQKLNENISFVGKICKERRFCLCIVIFIFIAGFYVIFVRKNNSDK